LVSNTTITELEHADPARLYTAIAGLPWPVWLESATRGRYDIIAADPIATVTTRGAYTTVLERGAGQRASTRPPLELVRERLGDRAEPVAGLPFRGGALGYFAYDLGRRYERIPSIAATDIALPEMAVGIYDWAVVVDRERGRAVLASDGRDSRTAAEWPTLVASLNAPAPPFERAPFRVLSRPQSNFTRAQYARAFDRVQRHIRRGDCYQVNLTQRFRARADGDAWHAYLRLRALNPAPFAAFLDFPDGRILSSSPERFLSVRGGVVETKPIKGTRPRGADAERDRALANELRASGKDRAENVMIVDLLRNDLGKSCEPGSVRVTKLFDVESYATVHQLVSTVEGRLAAGKHALDLLAGCFPGGSITGAPKVAAMEIIEDLEPQRRSIYCGAIGYVGFDGDMDTNIAIRTLLQHGDYVYAWAGGGVVADSNVDAEYQESFDKAAALLAVLNEQGGDAGARR
jgi:para-aminobenzoate synthetase component 1